MITGKYDDKRVWIFKNFFYFSKDTKVEFLKFVKEVTPKNLGKENEDYTLDLYNLPDEIVELIWKKFGPQTNSSLPKLEEVKSELEKEILGKRKREKENAFQTQQNISKTEKEGLETHGPDIKRRKLDKTRFKITLNVIDCTKRAELTDSEKQFQCSFCKKQFNDRSNLLKHVRTHTKEKPYQCKICKKRFRYSQTLKEHENSHIGKKPWQCSVCKRRFANKSNMKRHMRIHSNEMPYECDHCDKKFKQSTNLKNHLKVAHGIVVKRVSMKKN